MDSRQDCCSPDSGIAQITSIRPWTSGERRGSKTDGNRNGQRPWTTSDRAARFSKRDTDSGTAASQDESVDAWCMTELADDDESSLGFPKTTRFKSLIIEDKDEEEDDGICVSKEKDGLHFRPQRTGLGAWLREIADDSDEYDTELEDEFPPDPEPPPDATGVYVYESSCKKKGITPCSTLVRNLGEGSLKLRHYYLGGHGTKPLASALKRNTVCEEIDLSDNYVEGDGASALAKMLKDNMFVVNLNVSNNFMRSIGAHAFAEMLEANTTLKTLSLQGNQLSDNDAQRLSDAMKANMSLSVLDLSHNCFGEQGGVHLANGISGNIGLADLDLSWNGIREKGAIAIAKALQKNSSLEILDLSWNGMGINGGIAIAQTLRTNKSLRVLDISNNRLNSEAAIKLGQAIGKNEGLETLLMGMNPVGVDGVDAILKGAVTCLTLRLIGLEDISIAPEIKSRIEDIMSSRDILIMYTMGSPQQSKMNQTILAVFDRFISDNADRMEDLFHQMDKDKSGNITLEEFKYGLKDFGLRLTSKQLDMLLDELDADRSGTIEFDELMAGSNLVEQEKAKIERKARDEELMQQSKS